jgi:hypothetical protein
MSLGFLFKTYPPLASLVDLTIEDFFNEEKICSKKAVGVFCLVTIEDIEIDFLNPFSSTSITVIVVYFALLMSIIRTIFSIDFELAYKLAGFI